MEEVLKEFRMGKVGREEPKCAKSGNGGVFHRQKYRLWLTKLAKPDHG